MRARVAGRISVTAAALVLTMLAAACSSSKSSTATTSAPATTGAPSASSTTSATQDVLGTSKPATGDPVVVGLISNGVTAGINNQIELDMADATVKWLNDRQGGIGGRPIKLVTCTDQADPGKAADCANQLISQNVVAVVIGSSAVIQDEWKPLHDAKIPVVTFSGVGDLLKDPATTFTIGSPPSSLTIVPAAAAKAQGKTKISAMVIDVPAATDNYTAAEPALKQVGITLNLVRIPIGTPDMTPQAQQIVSGGDPGILNVLGNDTFCITAFNALRAVGFNGTITTAAPCITDATRKAVPGSYLKGMQLSYSAPVGDTTNKSYALLKAVVDTYGAGKDIDLSRTQAWAMFMTITGLQGGVDGISGDITPASIASTMKQMRWKLLPGAGGLHYRCNAKADPANPAVCLTGTLVSSLDASGNPTTYKVVNDTPIPD
jgi:branched-chain amino acid transport system substrate-binding protein